MTDHFLKFYTDTPKYTHAPGLEVMHSLMSRLGDPQRELRCVHIAGTNGKGSCAAMVSSILRAAGYRVGTYTSPDLTGPWERMAVDGVYISLSDFADITCQVKAACDGLDEPSYFEKMTAAAFLYFARQRCDYVVLETGLGGRLDATNIINASACSVIMPIGLDHTAQLGDTIAAIAGEKAGIIKTGCPVVCAPQVAEAEAVIRRCCAALGAPLYQVDTGRLTPLPRSPEGQRFSYKNLENLSIPLLGHHQLENAAAAIETARVLGLDESAIRAGLSHAQWPCRFEYLPGKPFFILDGAHNAHGAAALARGLEDYFPGQKFTMVMGVMEDKPWREMLSLLMPHTARFICLTPDGPRALPAEALASAISAVPAMTADSLEQAITLCRAHNEPVCAFGSLYYIGHLRSLLKENTAWK